MINVVKGILKANSEKKSSLILVLNGMFLQEL